MFGSVKGGEVRRVGDAALAISAWTPSRAAALAEALRRERIGGVTDVVGAFESVLVQFDPDRTDHFALAESVRSVRARRSARRSRKVEIPVAFDGPDIDEVGERSGLGADGVRRALLGARLRVEVLGFAPGFAYLSGLPRRLRSVPRRAPRSAVPKGSFAIAAGHAAVYPRASPGGWNLLGRTHLELFDPSAPPYALLAPGDEVCVVEATPGPGAAEAPAPGRSPWRVAHPAFVVLRPGTMTTLQDAGRPGVAHLGVPRAGAADPVALELANALLGNERDAPALEITLAGPTLLCRRAGHVAVVGPGAQVSVDGAPVGEGRVVPVGPGQRLAIGPSGQGARAYLAARGGFVAERVLGSCSSDRLAGLGPGALVEGDELAVGEAVGPMGDHLVPGSPGSGGPPGERALRVLVVEGPGPGGWQYGLFGRPFIVASESDRIGLRLRSGGPLLEPPARERPSAGVVTGAVQVPPDGDPVVLLPDHATLGGYPLAACVIGADLGELGRCRPGETVVFEPVTPEEAAAARRALRRALDGAVAGRHPTVAG